MLGDAAAQLLPAAAAAPLCAAPARRVPLRRCRRALPHPGSGQQVAPSPHVLSAQRRHYPRRYKIWPTEVDPFDRVEPKTPPGLGNSETARNEIHRILGWRDPRIDAGRRTGAALRSESAKSAAASGEPEYEAPPATRPSELTFQDIGTMYRLDDEDMRSYFQEGFAGLIVKAFAPPMQPRGFLYRKLSHLLNIYISKLEDFRTKKDVLYELRDGKSGFILDGPHGCGKSAIVNQCVHFARSRDMVTLFIPDAAEWTSGSFVVPSTVLPGFYDNPNETLELLKHFCRMEGNRHVLSQRKLSRKYPLPESDQRGPPETVWDLLHHAFDDIETTPVVFKYFLDELIAIKDLPVVFIVDSYDRFCKYTEYFDMPTDVLRERPQDGFDIQTLDKPRIHASQLTLVRALNYVAAANEPNKLIIGAACRQVGSNPQSTHDFSPFLPDQDTMLHTLQVPPAYDEYELRTILRFYLETMEGTDADGVPLDAGWSFRRLEMPGFERTLYKIRFLTNSNPYMVWHESEMRQYWRCEYDRQRQMLGRMRDNLLRTMQRQVGRAAG